MAVLAPEPVLEDMERQVSPPRRNAESSARWLLAACSLGAAALHFAYASAHFAEYWLYGVFFVTSAWLQLAWAVGLVVRPRRWLLLGGYAGNALIIVVWVLSRTVGVVVGPGASVKEAAAFPDILATVLEATVVAGALVLMVRPSLLARRFAVRVLSPVAVIGATLLIEIGRAHV